MTVTPFSVTIVSSGTVRSQLPPRSAARSTITEPGFIACYHVGRPQLRRRPAGDQGGGDDDVDLRRELAELGELLLAELGARGRGIAAGGGPVLRLLELEEDELRAHGLDLLGHLGAHVEGIGDGAERGRGADGGQPGDAGADHQHLGRRHLAGGRDLAGEEAAEVVAGLDHGAVAGDVGHRGERVHLLGARDARHHVHGDDGGALRFACSSRSAFCAGQKNEISVWPWRRRPTSSSVGGRTFVTTSVAAKRAAASGTMLTPAAA